MKKFIILSFCILFAEHTFANSTIYTGFIRINKSNELVLSSKQKTFYSSNNLIQPTQNFELKKFQDQFVRIEGEMATCRAKAKCIAITEIVRVVYNPLNK